MTTQEITSTPSAEQCADALSVLAAVAIARGVAPDAALAFDTNSETVGAVAAQFATKRSLVRLAVHLATEGRSAFNGAAILGLAERNADLIALARRHVALLTPPTDLRIPTESK
jgi:hypothetical protein